MNMKYALPATLVAGLVFGGVITTTLEAQGTPPAYVAALVDVHDTDTFTKEYAPKVAATLEPYGGRFLTSGKLAALEGNTPPRFVLIGFDSVDKATGWYNSPAYQQLVPIRQKAATATLFVAEGRAK